MMLQVTENGWIQNFLVSQPEAGMGYQFVDLYLKDGRFIAGVVAMNASLIVIPDHFGNITEDDILKVIDITL